MDKKETKQKSQFYLMVRRFSRNKAAVVCFFVILLLIFGAVFADVLTPYDYDAQDLGARLQYPSAEHLMGTDNFGRDIFTRILRGGRVSLVVSVISVGISIVLALVIGSVAGYFGGAVDTVIMRITDIFLAMPPLVFALTVSAALGTGLLNTAIALAISSVAPMVRQMRSSIMLMKSQEYIEASKAFGGGHARIIFEHVVPNAFTPLLVQGSMSIGDTIMSIAGLSFLGLGVQPPTPEWGNMLSAGQQFITKFWPMMLFPGLAIAITMLSFNMVGDGIRDALDPHMKQ